MSGPGHSAHPSPVRRRRGLWALGREALPQGPKVREVRVDDGKRGMRKARGHSGHLCKVQTDLCLPPTLLPSVSGNFLRL